MDGYEGEDDWEFGDPTWEPVDWHEFRYDLGWALGITLLIVVLAFTIGSWVVGP